jgi:prevent-host-death family protein
MARFSELVRRVRSEGPQHVTVNERDEVVVIQRKSFAASKAVSRGKRSLPARPASQTRAPARGSDHCHRLPFASVHIRLSLFLRSLSRPSDGYDPTTHISASGVETRYRQARTETFHNFLSP